MSPSRRVLAAVALTGAVAAAAPSAAGAQGTAVCTFPHALTDAPVATQYEYDLFMQQTQYDFQRLTSANAAAFTTVTLKRASAMVSAITGITTRAVTGTVSQPPRCP